MALGGKYGMLAPGACMEACRFYTPLGSQEAVPEVGITPGAVRQIDRMVLFLDATILTSLHYKASTFEFHLLNT